MQYHAKPCNTMQYNAMHCNAMYYRAVPCNTMQYHAIPCLIYTCWRSVPLPCGQYKAIFSSVFLCLCGILGNKLILTENVMHIWSACSAVPESEVINLHSYSPPFVSWHYCLHFSITTYFCIIWPLKKGIISLFKELSQKLPFRKFSTFSNWCILLLSIF